MSFFNNTSKADKKKQTLKELRTERRKQYLKEGYHVNYDRLYFSVDSIPFIITDNRDYLINGDQCYECDELTPYGVASRPLEYNEFRILYDDPNYNMVNKYNYVKFNREQTKDERYFMYDYENLLKCNTKQDIIDFTPNTLNPFTIQVFDGLKRLLISDIDIIKKDLIKEEIQPSIPSMLEEEPEPKPKSKPKPKQKPLNEPLEVSFKLDNGGYPYRSYNKLKSLYDDFNTIKFKKNIKPLNNFNVKESKKQYNLKTYSKVKYSFIGDIFFEGKVSAFLLLININTRYAYAYQLGKVNIKETTNIDNNNKEYIMSYVTTGRKTTIQLLKAFDCHIKSHPMNVLTFDGEKAIKSKRFMEFLKYHNIRFIPAKTEAHTSLSLIDRLCRTIRDIAYNLNYEGIYSIEIMNKILNYYNQSRHETLTNTLFKAYPELKNVYDFISPWIMENNEYDLETKYVKECIKYNFMIMSNPDYAIDNSNDIKIYNNGSKLEKKRSKLSKDNYKVIKNIGNIYELENERTKEKTYKPRYQIYQKPNINDIDDIYNDEILRRLYSLD